MKNKDNTVYSVPKPMQAIFDQIVAISDGLCAGQLNAEYAQVCRKMAATLCRKRPSPLLRGKIEIWAAAIVHTIAGVNFAYDPSQTPHITLDQLCRASGTAKTIAWYPLGPLAPRPRSFVACSRSICSISSGLCQAGWIVTRWCGCSA